MTALRIALLLALAGYGVALLIGAFSDRLILPAPPSGYARMERDMLRFPGSDGDTLVGLLLPLTEARYTVLYSHGNFEDLAWARARMEMLRELGLQVFGYDYRGYGLSGGTAGVVAATADARAAFDYVTGELGIPPERVILYGRSVGSGPSITLAMREPVAGLVLEGAFTSAFRVVTQVPILPFDRFDNAARIAAVGAPVLVLHGRRDRVVPFRHGPALFEAASEPKRHAWFAEAGHNDIPEASWEAYAHAVAGFLAEVERYLPATAGSDDP